MKLFSNESLYNVKTDQWEERYFIDGQEVDEDLYFFEIERERDLEIQKLEEAIELDENECDCPECTILKYVERIQEISDICPCCLEEILTDFMFDIIDHIVIEDVEEDVIDEVIEKEMKRFN